MSVPQKDGPVASPTIGGSSQRSLRVAFETHGCRSNFADTVDLESALNAEGAIPAPLDSRTDIFILNTCSVTDDADKTALRALRRVRREAPQARVVVTGCMAEVDRPALEALGIADAIIAPGRRDEILRAVFSSAALNGNEETGEGALPVAEPPPVRLSGVSATIQDSTGTEVVRTAKRRHPEPSKLVALPLSSGLSGPDEGLGELQNRARFHLRVQEGCENLCTFCIIPRARGGIASRPPTLILDDLERLCGLGYREVVLTGTHLGGFGEDCDSSLLQLIELLDQKSPIRRLRLSSLDPNDVSPALVKMVLESNVFCRHLHICVQAFADPVLKRMNRRYRVDDVKALVRYIESFGPDVCLGSDLIAGFPGESRQDVEQGIEAFLELPFSYLHVFPYSERSGTPATRLDGHVTPAERRRRAGRWRALSERSRRDFDRALVDKKLEIVVETITDSLLIGTSREFARVGVRRSGDESVRRGELLTVVPRRYNEAEEMLLCEL